MLDIDDQPLAHQTREMPIRQHRDLFAKAGAVKVDADRGVVEIRKARRLPRAGTIAPIHDATDWAMPGEIQ